MRDRDKDEADDLEIALPLLVRFLVTAKLFPPAAGDLQPIKKGRKVRPCSPIERAKR
jgi:hypothetical protein